MGYLVPAVGGGPCVLWFFPRLFFLVLRQSAPDEQLNALGPVGVEKERGREEGEREREIEIEIELVLSVTRECSQPGLVFSRVLSCLCPPARCDVLILCDFLILGGRESIVSGHKFVSRESIVSDKLLGGSVLSVCVCWCLRKKGGTVREGTLSMCDSVCVGA